MKAAMIYKSNKNKSNEINKIPDAKNKKTNK